MNSRELFLAACRCKKIERPPLWIMRQAGRYLPEYRALKSRYDFLTLVRTPELAAAVSLQPVQRFPLDAVIVFSDILVVPEAMGMGYSFRDGGGISMDFTLENSAQVDALSVSFIHEKLDYVSRTLKILRDEIGGKKALLGFAGSPWTLATYMLEGGSVGTGAKILNFAKNDLGNFHALMEKLSMAVSEYLLMQIAAGADAVQIFDTWGALCNDTDYVELSLQWVRQIIATLPENFPVILYAKDKENHAAEIARSGVKIVSVSHRRHLSEVKKKLGDAIAVQGNLAPEILCATPEIVRENAGAILREMRNFNGHIFNLGHGILPDAKLENVTALVETVRSWRNDAG